ncbi:PD-(D/E)XK nuclease family protein [bacterium]|nr:PD-(D/E)XK nuclease family protein [bacterium]
MAKKKAPQIVREIQKNPPEPVNFAFEKNISYSQLSMYTQCPKKWALQYRDGHKVKEQSIHMTFGTALHETLQMYLDVMYNESGVTADSLDLETDFEIRLKGCYAKAYKQNKNEHFTDAQTLREFYSDGVEIINYLRKNRRKYFSKRGWWLVGCEVPIVLAPNPHLPRVKYMGFLDVVMYNETTNKFIIIDIKTSTRGWNDKAKKDKSKQHQLVLYKKFFAQQYNVPIDDIDIEFFIVKRKLYESQDFVIKRIQQFRPPSGKTSVNQATKSLNEFLDNCFTSEGYNEKDMPALTNNNCKWCPYFKTHLCSATFEG